MTRQADRREYGWGWTHFGGALPGLSVWYADEILFGGDTIAGAVPPERAGDLPWQDLTEPWGEYVSRSFQAARGDRSRAIPRIVAAHALGRDPSPAELAAVRKLTRPASRSGEAHMSVSEADVRAALDKIPGNPPANKPGEPKMPTATVKTALCPMCGREVDVKRGKLADHPTKVPPKGKATVNLCPGSGVKPVPEGAQPTGAWSGAEAANLAPGLCDPDPSQPRKDLGDLSELALSLIAQGMLEPVIVSPGPTEGRYTTIAGHRRVAAALLAGLPEIPALIRADLIPGSNVSIAAQVVENLHRLPLTPLEEARAYDLLRQIGMKQGDIATAVGVNQGQVSKRLALLKLPEELGAKVGAETGLDVATAVEITRLPAAAQADVIAQVNKGADAEVAVRRARAASDSAARHQAVIDDLETRRVALVDFPTTWHWGRDREDRPLLTGIDGEPQTYGGARTIEVPYVDHADLPCHGAAVSPNDDVVYVCLDPTLHGYKSADEETAELEAGRTAAQEAAEIAKAAETARLAARRDAARALALAPVDRAYQIDVVASWVVDGLSLDIAPEVAPEPSEIVETIIAWGAMTDGELDEIERDDAELLAWQTETLVAQHGTLRVAFMTAVAGVELLLELPGYYRGLIAGSSLVRDHFGRLSEIADYEPTVEESAFMAPSTGPAPLELPDEEPPAGAIAYWRPGAEAILEGDEARWILDEGEASAIALAGQGGHVVGLLLMLDDVAAFDDSEGTDEANASPVDEADPIAAEFAEHEAQQEPEEGCEFDHPHPGHPCGKRVDDELPVPPEDHIDPGDKPTPGELCPASRRDFNIAGGADGIPCPLKCGALVSTTKSGRVRDHDVPESEAVEA